MQNTIDNNYFGQYNLPMAMSSVTSPPIDAINTPLVFYNHWRTDELNARLASRIYPDMVIPPSISGRPDETRQTILGKSVDPRLGKTPIPIIGHRFAASSIHDNFICGDHGEPNWFLANIDTETILRNQTFALQKECIQSTYIPSSDSELYRPTVPIIGTPVLQPYPHLFEKTRFSENVRATLANRRDLFPNDSRNQYIGDTGSRDLYRPNGVTKSVPPNVRTFSNVDRASLSQPFKG
jgi:hypothetical protein